MFSRQERWSWHVKKKQLKKELFYRKLYYRLYFDPISATERLTVEEFKQWYHEHNDRPDRSFLDLSRHDYAPF